MANHHIGTGQPRSDRIQGEDRPSDSAGTRHQRRFHSFRGHWLMFRWMADGSVL